MTDTLSLVLFSGTDDKLQAAATLAAGASALGRPVNVLLQFWALDAFRTVGVVVSRGLSPDAGAEGARVVRDRAPTGQLQWLELFRQAKELGEMQMHACGASMELLGLESGQLDPMVDDVCGIATFFAEAENGQILFI